MTTNEITEILMCRGYSKSSASLVASEIQKINASLIPLWEAWLEDENNCQDYKSEGYSISYFMKSRHMKFPAALLTIDWLLKEPKNALTALKKG